MLTSEMADRFWSKVQEASAESCWEWTAYRSANGYGTFRTPVGKRYAHRVAYELMVGPIPEGLQLDHLCKNRACVNPAHLEPVTCRENLMRGDTLQAANARKTHCNSGHPLSGPNLYPHPNGTRKCRACMSAAGARYRRRLVDRMDDQ